MDIPGIISFSNCVSYGSNCDLNGRKMMMERQPLYDMDVMMMMMMMALEEKVAGARGAWGAW